MRWIVFAVKALATVLEAVIRGSRAGEKQGSGAAGSADEPGTKAAGLDHSTPGGETDLVLGKLTRRGASGHGGGGNGVTGLGNGNGGLGNGKEGNDGELDDIYR